MMLIRLYEDAMDDAARQIGNMVRRVTKTKTANSVLNSDPSTSGGTFTRGGCANLAFALNQVFPESKICGIRRENGRGIVDHVMIQLGNQYIDGDGASTESELLQRWAGIVENPAIVPVKREELGKIPYSDTSIQKYRHIFANTLKGVSNGQSHNFHSSNRDDRNRR